MILVKSGKLERMSPEQVGVLGRFCFSFQFLCRAHTEQPMITFPGALKLALMLRLPRENLIAKRHPSQSHMGR
jgi:hypothetical protein